MNAYPVVVVFFGDSITEGQYVDPRLRWTDLLSAEITKEHLTGPANLQFLNKGISGQTTRQALERFPEDVQRNRPDVLTIQFGLNDCNCWTTDFGHSRVSLPAYRANLVEMIDRAKLAGVPEIILSTNHKTLRRKRLLNQRSLEESRLIYNDTVRQIAAETQVTLCDIDKVFADCNDAELEDLLLPYPDHLHLSESGHRRYAACIRPFIISAIEKSASHTSK